MTEPDRRPDEDRVYAVSIEAMNWVWKHSKAKPATRLVLLSLADRAGADHGDCWPSIADIAQRTALSPRQVQRQLAKLRELGEIVVDERKGPHGTNRYRLAMGGDVDVRGDTRDRVTSESPGVTSKVKNHVAGDTRIISEPPIESRLDPDEVSRLGEEAARLKAELRQSQEEDWEDGPQLSRAELRAQREEATRAARSTRQDTVLP